MRFPCVLVVFLILMGIGSAQEQAAASPAQVSEPQAPVRGDSFYLGAAVVYRNGLYEDADSEVMVIPSINLEKGQFFLKGRTAGYRLFQDDLLALDAIAQWRFDGYDEDDGDFLEGMDDREMTIDGGAALTVFDGWGQTSISLVSDLLSKHSGQELLVAYSKSFSFEKWSLTPSVGVRGFSSSLGDYYYGVESEEAVAGRPAYNIGETWNPFTGVQVIYDINEQWSAMTGLRYTWLDSDIEDSPIVEDAYDLLVTLGVQYKF